ncbi:hypothetical protein GEMRC1_002340 [Eukaryota sp. GEM-RC1]
MLIATATGEIRDYTSGPWVNIQRMWKEGGKSININLDRSVKGTNSFRHMTQTNPSVNDSGRRRSKAKSEVDDVLVSLTPDDCLKNSRINDLPSKTIVLQQSLLTPIISHMLTSVLSCSGCSYDTDTVKEELPIIFTKVGYVSKRFLDSTVLSVKVFLEGNSFAVAGEGFPALRSLLPSNPSQIKNFAKYSQIIAGLSFTFKRIGDFDFLKSSSPCYCPNLKYLDCGNLFAGAKIGKRILDGVKVLAEALKTNSTMEELNFNASASAIPPSISIALWIKLSFEIVELHFKPSAKAIIPSYITSLFLDCNRIGAEGAIALAETLKTNITLEKLYLHDNSMGGEGVIALANALKTNSTVTEIILSNNVIYDEGAFAFAELLKINSTLTILDLSGNPLGPEGATTLAEVMEVNSSITEIDVTVNCVDFRLAPPQHSDEGDSADDDDDQESDVDEQEFL